MMMMKACLLWLLIGWSAAALAQQPATSQAKQDSVVVETIPGETEISSPAKGVRHYLNGVRFQHRGTLLSCDEATHYLATNQIAAHGHILLMRGDSITSSSDSARYDGNTRQLTLLGNVLFEHHRTELTTPRLDCDLITGLIRYAGQSRLTDGPNVLTSLRGQYNPRTRRLIVHEQVALATPHSTSRSDSLQYTLTERAKPVDELALVVPPDEMDPLRQRNTDQQMAFAAKTGRNAISTRSQAESVMPRPAPVTLAKKTASSVDPNPGTPKQLMGQVPRAVAPARPAAKPTDRSAEESDLERVLNRTQRKL